MGMTAANIMINERNALVGILCAEHYNLKDRLVNDINLILLVVKMCMSKVKGGNVHSCFTVFEVEMAQRKN